MRRGLGSARNKTPASGTTRFSKICMAAERRPREVHNRCQLRNTSPVALLPGYRKAGLAQARREKIYRQRRSVGSAVSITPDPTPDMGAVTITPDAPPQSKPPADYVSDFGKHFATGIENAATPFLKASAPNVALQVWRHIQGQPNTLKDIPESAVQAFLMSGGFGEEVPPEMRSASAPEAAAPAKAADLMQHPGLKPWMDAAKAEILKFPGANLLKTVYDSAKGFAEGTPEAPAATTPAVPETNGIPWGTKGPGPLELRGKMIPSEAAAAPVTSATEIPKTPTPVKPALVEKQLNDALGGQSLVPGVSLRNQPAAQADGGGQTPCWFYVGRFHCPAGYKYDPGAQEFNAIT